jgi:hypothetical protein
MIRTQLQTAAGEHLTGGEELVQRWQAKATDLSG